MRSQSTKKTIYLCLAESLEKNGTRYIQLLDSLRKKLTEESVHEIRVTIRKLEACLGLLDALGIHNKRLVKDLQYIRKIHGPLRNIHVELETIRAIEDRVKSKKFKIFLKKHQNKIEKKLEKELGKISSAKQLAEIQKVTGNIFKKNTTKLNEKALKTMEALNQKIIREFEKTKQDFCPDSPKSIHVIRITAKRIRYQGEIMKPAISFDNINLRQLKHFQDIFGKIQNNNILQKSIDKFLSKQFNKGSKSILKLQMYLAKEQKTLMASVSRMKGMRNTNKT